MGARLTSNRLSSCASVIGFRGSAIPSVTSLRRISLICRYRGTPDEGSSSPYAMSVLSLHIVGHRIVLCRQSTTERRKHGRWLYQGITPAAWPAHLPVAEVADPGGQPYPTCQQSWASTVRIIP